MILWFRVSCCGTGLGLGLEFRMYNRGFRVTNSMGIGLRLRVNNRVYD